MDRITDLNAAGTLPALPTFAGGSVKGYFQEENAGTGAAATLIRGYWLNEVQEELMAFLTAAGITPSASNLGQVLAACQTLFAPSNSLGGLELKVGFDTAPASGFVTSNKAVVFPLAYPTGCYFASVMPAGFANSTAGYLPSSGVFSRSASGFTAWFDTLSGGAASPVDFNQSVGFAWMAWGN